MFVILRWSLAVMSSGMIWGRVKSRGVMRSTGMIRAKTSGAACCSKLLHTMVIIHQNLDQTYLYLFMLMFMYLCFYPYPHIGHPSHPGLNCSTRWWSSVKTWANNPKLSPELLWSWSGKWNILSICAIENSRYLFYIKAVDQREPAFWSFDFSERGGGDFALCSPGKPCRSVGH